MVLTEDTSSERLPHQGHPFSVSGRSLLGRSSPPDSLPSRALLCPCTQGWRFTDGTQSQGEPSMLPWQRSGVTGWGQAGSREETTPWWRMLWKGAACSLGAPRYF